MTSQFKSTAMPLFKSAGVPAMDANCCCGGDGEIPDCAKCEGVAVTGGTIEFTGIPSSLTSTKVIGSTTHTYNITLDLNHSRAITLTITDGACCWSAAYAKVGEVNYVYERIVGGIVTYRYRGTVDLTSSITDGPSLSATPYQCPFGTIPFIYVVRMDQATIVNIDGSPSDRGAGSSLWEWSDNCGGLYGGTDDIVSLFPFPNRFWENVCGYSRGSLSPFSGRHAIDACPFNKTLNCSFGNVEWSPA